MKQDKAGLEKLQETTVLTVTPRSSLTRILLYTDPSSSANHTPRGMQEPALCHHPVKSVQLSWVIFQLVTRTESLASVWRMEEGLKKRTLLRPSQRPGLSRTEGIQSCSSESREARLSQEEECGRVDGKCADSSLFSMTGSGEMEMESRNTQREVEE